MLIATVRQLAIKLCEQRLFSKHISVTNNLRVKQFKNSIKMEMEFSNSTTSPDVVSKNSEKLIRVNNIVKSQQDNREYRGLQLDNGIKALLISDSTTDVAATALAVNVGHMCDPDNLPGLAHFCEHMLFLGTQKYPNENEFLSFLSQNGGCSNAATYGGMTKYYFDIVPDKLEDALDRFSQFFISPLFTESATDRELNAVNSEHEKNIPIDGCRIRQVKKHLAKKNHPYSKFGTGNKETLEIIPKEQNINVRDELIKFHQKWYSSNIMNLAVFGKESLDELESMVISKFQDVENKNVELPVWDKDPYNLEEYATKVYVIPIKDMRSLSLTFLTDDLEMHYKSSPEQYISHLIGHEGKGSILSELKERGWCNDLTAGHSNTSKGYGFFTVTVDLTEDGFEHVDDIVLLIFQYIKMLKNEKPQKWIFEENCKINQMVFRFNDKENPMAMVTNVVHSMQLFPLEEVLSAPYLSSVWQPELIENLLNIFTPDNCRITIVGQKLASVAQDEEPYYKTKYHKEKISESTLKAWTDCDFNIKLKLPEPNSFVPTDFDLCPQDPDLTVHPFILFDSPEIRLWHKQDTEFLKPKTFLNFNFSNPIAYADPLNCNLTHMMIALFRDHLTEYLYDANLAGLKLLVMNTTSGISLNIQGYSHKQNVLLQKVLDLLFDFELNEQRFEILKDEYIRTLKNFLVEQPFQHAIYYLALILTEHAWSKVELLDAMKLVTIERLEHFTRDFLSRMHTECFIYGNANKKAAFEVLDIVRNKLDKTNSIVLPLLARQLLQKREYKLCDGENYLLETTNKYHKSSCTELYLQCGSQTDTSNIFIDLVAQVLNEPFFNTLRTKEQLGYIVFCGSRKVNGATGIRFIVQSAKHPGYVEERIEDFLENMKTQIEEMTEDEFNRHKDALTTQKLEKPKRLAAKFFKYLPEISQAEYHFERAEAEVAILKNISKQELLNFYKKYMLKDSPIRHALCIYIISSVDKPEENEQPQKQEQSLVLPSEKSTANDTSGHTVRRVHITDLLLFKCSKELFPVARPHIDIRPKGARSKL